MSAITLRKLAIPFLCLLLAAGCTVQRERRGSAALFDLGPLPSVQSGAPVLSMSVAEPLPASWLDTQMMYYRLDYANRQEPNTYASHRWVMPPAQLVGQRIKSRIAAAGGVAADASHGATNLPTLRIELDEFTHVFESPSASRGRVSLRASLYNGRTLLAQKSFTATAPAASADAPGGASALATATDAAIGDMMTWLAGVPRKP